MQKTQLQLKTTSILTVPFQIYENDFMFIVNGKGFKTSRILSDILSPKISQIHSIDPTFNEFIITTHNQGDFTSILKLLTFQSTEIPTSEIPFIAEIIELFENTSIDIPNQDQVTNVTLDNVFDLLKNQNRYKFFYSKSIQILIDFISTNFYEISEKQEDEMTQLSLDTIIRIINNSKLLLKTESQLLKFVNKLYVKDRDASVLYEFVQFANVDSESLEEFLSVFDINDITIETWEQLKEKLRGNLNKTSSQRYKEKEKVGIEFKYDSNQHFNGIFHNFGKNSNGIISNDVNITSSADTDYRQPKNVVQYNNSSRDSFYSINMPDQWICFELKNHQLIPSCYEILSSPFPKGNHHPKSWVIEASNDGKNWTIIDEQNNCSYLNDKSVIHCFPIETKDNKSFRYFRFHSTGENWYHYNIIMFHSIEFYGSLI